MARKKKTELTLEQIIQDDQLFDELKEVVFDNGTFTRIHVRFRPTAVDKLLEQYSAFLIEIESAGIKLSESNMTDYLMLHVIQQFSTLVPVYPQNIFEKIDIFNQMIDNAYIEKICASYDPAEISKIYARLMTRITAYKDMANSDPEFKQKITQQLTNMGHEDAAEIESLLLGKSAVTS